MDNESRAVIFSLGTLLGWGLENAVSKKYSNVLGASKLIIYRNLITTLVAITAFLILQGNIATNYGYLLLGVILATLGYFGYYFLLKALKNGDLGMISPVSSSRVVISAFVGSVFLHDTLDHPHWIFIFIIFAGVILASLDLKHLKDSGILSLDNGIAFAILNAVIWGIVFPLYSIPSAIVGAFLFSVILEGTGFILSLVQTRYTKTNIMLAKEGLKSNLLGLLIIGVTGGAASVLVSLAYATGKVTTVSTVSSAVPLVTILYGKLVYKERLKRRQYMAVFLMTIGIVCLAYFKNV